MRGQCYIASVASCSQIIRVPWKLNYYILFHLNFSIQIQFSLFAGVLLLNVFNSKVHLPCTIAMIWNIPVTPNLFCLPCFFSLVYLIFDTRRWGADAAKSLQSCPTLRDPMDCSLPGSSIHGIFQARVLEWGAIAFSRWGASCPITSRATLCWHVVPWHSTRWSTFTLGSAVSEVSEFGVVYVCLTCEQSNVQNSPS